MPIFSGFIHYGLCVHGVYEYMRPVIYNGIVIAIIFVGNILTDEGYGKLLTIHDDLPFDTMERDFDVSKCREIAMLIEGYIHILLEKYGTYKENTIVSSIKSYIAENMENDLYIQDLSKYFSYSNVYLGRVFKQKPA